MWWGLLLSLCIVLAIFSPIIVSIVKSLPVFEEYNLPPGTEIIVRDAGSFKIGGCYRLHTDNPFKKSRASIIRITDYDNGYVQYRYFWNSVSGWHDKGTDTVGGAMLYREECMCPVTVWEKVFQIGTYN